MNRYKKSILFATLLGLAAALAARAAEPRTVCTITVNSADEREAFRRHLPADKFRFVELVERGRPDWLASACRQGVQCDVLVVSGHFAGTEFYSSKFDVNESLPVDEIERVQCSESCPGLFSKLQEVYLFGCDSLKPEPVRSAAPEIVRGLVRAGQSRAEAERAARALSERFGENSRDHMRRIFPGVPVIYGFSSLAPYGRVAGPMLERHLEAGADEVGSGRPSARLLKLFGPSSMVFASGLREGDPGADYRAEACRFHDERIAAPARLAWIGAILGGEPARARMQFDRIEKLFAALGERERAQPALAAALAALAADRATREAYLGLVRATEDPALRVRMVALARAAGWLDASEERAELGAMIGELLARGSLDYGEVDLICALNRDRALDAQLQRIGAQAQAGAAQAAARACLGSAESRARVLRALASPSEHEVRIAQAYLRHHPIEDPEELRATALGVARMEGAAAQARALDALARHRIADRQVLEEFARLFARATSLGVQRAIAEVFLRADARDAVPPKLAELLRKHRLKSHDGRDLIDQLIERLKTS